ncbi:MAG: M48 family metallopeptidase [Deferribacterales bacterium]
MSDNILSADTPFGVINFTHSVKKGLKRIYIRINRDGSVVLRSAPLRSEDAERIISQKSQWILSKQSEKQSVPDGNPLEYITYLGKKYKTERIFNQKMPVGRIRLSFEGESALLEFNPLAMTDDKLTDYLDKFYRDGVKKTVPQMMEKWVGITGLKPVKVTYRKTRSRWGSCSGRGNISLSIYLMKLSERAIEYVIVHELCHLKHHNHSKNFWDEVKKYIPDYQAVRAGIRTLSV